MRFFHSAVPPSLKKYTRSIIFQLSVLVFVLPSVLERTDRDARPTRPTLAAYRPWPRGCRNLAVQSCGSSHLFSRCSHEHSQRPKPAAEPQISLFRRHTTMLGASGFICRTDDKHAVAVSEEGEPRSCRVEWASCTRVAWRGKTGGVSIQHPESLHRAQAR